jgi:hypothetical protein
LAAVELREHPAVVRVAQEITQYLAPLHLRAAAVEAHLTQRMPLLAARVVAVGITATAQPETHLIQVRRKVTTVEMVLALQPAQITAQVVVAAHRLLVQMGQQPPAVMAVLALLQP